MSAANPSPSIFRKYDIRGIVGVDLDAGVAAAVGRALGAELRGRCGGRVAKVVVGQDNRPSSPELAAALTHGLRSAGCAVTTLGMVPTPVAYFSEFDLNADGAVQITGSHNPPEYNGIKMTMGGRALYGDVVQALLRRIREDDYEPAGPDGSRSDAALPAGPPPRSTDGGGRAPGERPEAGSVAHVDPIPAYLACLADCFGAAGLPGEASDAEAAAAGRSASRARRPKIVVDCGNGTASVVAVDLLQAVGAEVVPLYCESDGTFPNHHPDPTVDENVADLSALVLQHGADAGVGFDGDADRIGVVDDRGRIVRGDTLLLLFGLDLLRRRGPGHRIVFDIKCSQVLPEEIEKAGGVPVMWKTGHSLIKEKMRETGALLAGELSGHVCFADEYFGFDDALYAACRLVRMLSADERPLSHAVAALPSMASTPELRIDVAEEEKFAIQERAREHFSASHEVMTLDGARILFEGGWGLIRASNTQPGIVLRLEARDEARLAEIRTVVEDWLRGEGVRV